MKVNLATIENAVILYINKELCPKLGDVRKWLLPVIAGSMIPSMEKLYLKHKETILSTILMQNIQSLTKTIFLWKL